MRNWKAWLVVLIIIGGLIGALFAVPGPDTPNPGVDSAAGR